MATAGLCSLGKEAMDGQYQITKTLNVGTKTAYGLVLSAIPYMDECCCKDHAGTKILCNEKGKFGDTHALCSLRKMRSKAPEKTLSGNRQAEFNWRTYP